MIRKRIVSTVLAVLLAASSLAGMSSCRKKNAEPTKEKRTNVYAGEDIALPDDMEYVDRVFTAGTNTYITYSSAYTVTYNDMGEEVERTPGYNWDENEKKQESLPEGWWFGYDSQQMLCTVNVDTKEITVKPFNFDEELYGYVNTSFCGGPDGTLISTTTKWEYNEDYTESKNTTYLVTVDPASGEVVSSVVLNDALVKGGADPNNLYLQGTAVRGDEIYCATDGQIFVIDTAGNYKTKIDLNMADGWINSLGVCGDRLVIGCYDGGPKLKVYENGEISTIPGDQIGNSGAFIACDNENVYFNTSTGVNAYNLTAGTYGEVLNYINSDMMSSGDIAFLEDGRVIIANTEYNENGNTTTLGVFHRVPDEELAEEIILRLGCTYVNYSLRRSIIRYNKQNTGVRVSVVDYSSYDNESNEYTGAETQFNNDLATGKLPDIVMISSSMPVENYFRKNIFADLYPYIDDEEKGVNRGMLESNLLSSNETKGKLFSLILTYSVNTLVAKNEMVGTESGWDFAGMMKAIRAMPEGGRAFFEYSRDDIINNFFQYSMDSFINWETGETYFNTPGFIDFVNYLKTCPEKGWWEEIYGEGYEYDPEIDRKNDETFSLRFYRNNALFQMLYMGRFSDFLYSLNQFATNEVNAIGYPREGEGNGAVIIPDIELAISNKSTAKDQAWEVLKFFLNDDGIVRNGSFSINKQAMDELYSKTREDYGDYTPADEDFDWMRESGYTEEYIDFQKNSRRPYDQAAVDYIRGIVEGATKIARTDDALVEIVREDLSAVFAGAKSAEDAAKQIASRVGIYVSEHS